MNILPLIKPIVDPDIKNCFSDLDWITLVADKEKWLGNPQTGKPFMDMFKQWITSSKLNYIQGLDDFPEQYIINGCTEAITEYHWMFRDRRLRLIAGEYMFTANMTMRGNFTWLHEDDLREGDALIVSVPFAWTGDVPEDFDKIMETCSTLNIPVLIDCCWFGMCHDIEIKVNYPCVQGVCFSTSKAFASGSFRVGTLFAKNSPNHIKALNTYFYTPLLAAVAHTQVLQEFSADYMPTKYKERQLEICESFDFEVKPSKSVVMVSSDRGYPGLDLSAPQWKNRTGGRYANGWPTESADPNNYQWGIMNELTSWANLN